MEIGKRGNTICGPYPRDREEKIGVEKDQIDGRFHAGREVGNIFIDATIGQGKICERSHEFQEEEKNEIVRCDYVCCLGKQKIGCFSHWFRGSRNWRFVDYNMGFSVKEKMIDRHNKNGLSQEAALDQIIKCLILHFMKPAEKDTA